MVMKYFNFYWLVAVNFTVPYQSLPSSPNGKANTSLCRFNLKALTKAGIDETVFFELL